MAREMRKAVATEGRAALELQRGQERTSSQGSAPGSRTSGSALKLQKMHHDSKKTKQSQPSAGKTLFFRGLHQCAMLIPKHCRTSIRFGPRVSQRSKPMGPLCHLLVGFRV